MRFVVSGAVLVVGLVCTAALAADLPSRRAPQPIYTPPPVFSWTGFYFGGNAGYAFDGRTAYSVAGDTAADQRLIAIGDRPSYVATRASGFTGGGQIGYNFELGNGVAPSFGLGGGLVAGVEADAAYTDLRGNGEFDGPAGFRRSLFNSRTDFVGTARGRLGYAIGSLLIYGTGGFAYGGVRNNITYYYAPTRGPNYQNGSDTIRTGYTYGGGVEYAIPTTSFLNVFQSSAVTVKAEFLHYDLGSSTVPLTNLLGAPNSYTARVHTEGNLVRAGINYKFGATPAAPVVARY